jgi:hypothetical protein
MPNEDFKDFSEALWQGLSDAVTDIRQKVVEEPMYGRAVTDGPGQLEWPEPQAPALGSLTHERELEPQQDIDLDR